MIARTPIVRWRQVWSARRAAALLARLDRRLLREIGPSDSARPPP